MTGGQEVGSSNLPSPTELTHFVNPDEARRAQRAEAGHVSDSHVDSTYADGGGRLRLRRRHESRRARAEAENGSYDRLPWTFDLGANVTYKHSFGNAEMRVKFAIFNLLDQQRVTEVVEDLEQEDQIGTFNPFFLQGTDYQQSRHAQLTLSLDF